MPKKKNPATCRIKPGDRITRDFGNVRNGVYLRKDRNMYVVRWDGNSYDDWYYRYELLADLTPTEPEPYEAWFVA